VTGSARFHPAYQETAVVAYRIVGVHGMVGANFTGSADAVCQSLGTCGASGAVSLSPQLAGTPRGESLTFSGQRIVGRRVGRTRALDDLRAGRLSMSDNSFLVSFVSTLTDRLARPQAPDCNATLTERVSALSSRVHHGFDRFAFVGSSFGPPTFDSLRAYCPGPTTADIVGHHSLATGALALSRLGTAHLTLTLTSSGGFDAFG
jgi:hypothetical protein